MSVSVYTCYGFSGTLPSRQTYWLLRGDVYTGNGVFLVSPLTEDSGASVPYPFICRWDSEEFQVFDPDAPFGQRFIKFKTFELALDRLIDLDTEYALQKQLSAPQPDTEEVIYGEAPQ